MFWQAMMVALEAKLSGQRRLVAKEKQKENHNLVYFSMSLKNQN